MAYHIWRIITNRSSLWVKWIHTFRIKGRSIWHLKVPWDASISWKRILSIREDFRHFFHSEIGNGSETFFWSDRWILEEPFTSRISPRIIASMGYDGKEKVLDFVVDGQVVFPARLLLIWPDLAGKIILVTEARKDRVMWKSRNGKKSVFRTSTVWNDFKVLSPRVEWKNLVWFSQSIPKHSFILWLAIRGKLLT